MRRRWSSETVRTLRRSAESRERKRSAIFWASAPGRQAQVGLVAGPRAAGQEPGLLDARAGDEDARAEGAAHAHVARHVLDRGPQHEARLAEGDLVADLRAERDEERGVGDGAARLGEARPLAGGGGLDRAVERVAGVDGQHLGEPRRLAARPEDHRAEVHDARHVGRRARRARAPRRGAPRRPPRRARPRRGRGRRRAAPAPRLRTDSRRLSVNELMATRAPTPIATASTMSRPRRREARDSRQARRQESDLGGAAPHPPGPPLATRE